MWLCNNNCQWAYIYLINSWVRGHPSVYSCVLHTLLYLLYNINTVEALYYYILKSDHVNHDRCRGAVAGIRKAIALYCIRRRNDQSLAREMSLWISKRLTPPNADRGGSRNTYYPSSICKLDPFIDMLICYMLYAAVLVCSLEFFFFCLWINAYTVHICIAP